MCQCQTIHHAKIHYQPKNYFPSIKNTRFTASPILKVLDAPYCTSIGWSNSKAKLIYGFAPFSPLPHSIALDKYDRTITISSLMIKTSLHLCLSLPFTFPPCRGSPSDPDVDAAATNDPTLWSGSAKNYVAKRYIESVSRKVYFDDVKLQMDAKLWGEEFNKYHPPKPVSS